MATRIAGVDLPEKKRIVTALTWIFGIGLSQSQKILEKTNISPDVKAGELSSTETNMLRDIIEKNYKVEGELHQDITQNVKRLQEIGSYRGSRHARQLPVRGQRTKTNSRTVRGNVRRTAGSGRKSAAEKT